MDELIARLEAAAEGSDELDAAIAVATFSESKQADDLIYAVPARKDDNCAPRAYWRVCRSGRSLQTAPNYTNSIDAALSLVPEKHWWSVTCNARDLFDAWCTSCDLTGSSQRGLEPMPWVTGRTPALALCIAALKARSHTAPQEK